MNNNYRKVGIVDTENGGIKFVSPEEAGEHLGKTAGRLSPDKPEKTAKKEQKKAVPVSMSLNKSIFHEGG